MMAALAASSAGGMTYDLVMKPDDFTPAPPPRPPEDPRYVWIKGQRWRKDKAIRFGLYVEPKATDALEQSPVVTEKK